MTEPPHEWPTSTTLPGCASMARLAAATSSSSEVSGFCTATTCRPLACSSGITLAQSEPSAKAPWTMTTLGLEVSGVAGAAGAAAVALRAENDRPMTAAAAASLKRWVVFMRAFLAK
jgi:hypothetical protein